MSIKTYSKVIAPILSMRLYDTNKYRILHDGNFFTLVNLHLSSLLEGSSVLLLPPLSSLDEVDYKDFRYVFPEVNILHHLPLCNKVAETRESFNWDKSLLLKLSSIADELHTSVGRLYPAMLRYFKRIVYYCTVSAQEGFWQPCDSHIEQERLNVSIADQTYVNNAEQMPKLGDKGPVSVAKYFLHDEWVDRFIDRNRLPIGLSEQMLKQCLILPSRVNGNDYGDSLGQIARQFKGSKILICDPTQSLSANWAQLPENCTIADQLNKCEYYYALKHCKGVIYNPKHKSVFHATGAELEWLNLESKIVKF